MRKAEIIFSANYFGVDENTGSEDGERILDRVAAIPFVEWDEMPATEFSNKQDHFKKVVDNPDKPTTLLIGEIGDFLMSVEFKDKSKELANMLYEKTDECIKTRTVVTQRWDNASIRISYNWAN